MVMAAAGRRLTRVLRTLSVGGGAAAQPMHAWPVVASSRVVGCRVPSSSAAAAAAAASPSGRRVPLFLHTCTSSSSSSSSEAVWHNAIRQPSSISASATAVIAIGSNQGDRVELFRKAAAGARAARESSDERHSSLYETAPAYVTDQPSFLNAAAVVRVADPAIGRDPLRLLDALKAIEFEPGRREGGVRFGPRQIDLDIIFHSGGGHTCARLQIPHPRYAERWAVQVDPGYPVVFAVDPMLAFNV